MAAPLPVFEARGLTKVYHLGEVEVHALRGVDLDLFQSEFVVILGPSGSGKSTLLRSIYANYKPDSGRIAVRHGERWVDMVSASPQRVLEVRKRTLGYVSQFLRAIPRVSALDVVAEPLRALGTEREAARARARALLARLNIPERLWQLPPVTFSGGEQQRVNIARGFIVEHPILLLDEPTASLDETNAQVVIGLIAEALGRGTAIVGIFHDAEVRAAAATRTLDLQAA